jgi:Pectate lyase superfamily protein/IPT/TIG domain
MTAVRSPRRYRALALIASAVVVVALLLDATMSVAAATPSISSFSPMSGPVGTAVTVTGTGFTGATKVSFGLTSAVFSVVSDTTIDTTVPNNAVRSRISVHTPSGDANSRHRYFKVTPSIISVSPSSGQVGTAVTITGTALTNGTQVSFNGVVAALNTVTYSQIATSVPTGATSGPLKVTTRWGSTNAASDFTVTQVFDVTTYGAVGDGTGDNTAAFKAAITAAQAAGSGSIVSIPAGTYVFTTGSPASVQIDGNVSITFAGAGRDTTKLIETTPNRDLVSIKCDHTVIQDLTLDTQTYNGGHPLGDGANYTTVQRMQILDGSNTFGIYFPGPPGARDDKYTGDGFSFSFQYGGSISNIWHTGSHITLYVDNQTTVANYYYTPGTQGRTAGFILSTPCFNITITNFRSSGEGGWIRTAPTPARVNQNITIDGEIMTGGSSMVLKIGDVQGLLVENSTLLGIVVDPTIIAQGTVTSSTYTSVTSKPQGTGVDELTFS